MKVFPPLVLTALVSLQAEVSPVPAEVLPQKIPGVRARNVVFILADDH